MYNSIKSLLDKSDYKDYYDFLNFKIDGYWLDEKLDEIYPGNMYRGLIPTLLPWMEIDKEREIVWERILPFKSNTSICPILMCPDDLDFSCTLIVAEIHNLEGCVIWKRLGIDKTKEYEAEKTGSEVEWFDKIGSFTFKKEDYMAMLQNFRNFK